MASSEQATCQPQDGEMAKWARTRASLSILLLCASAALYVTYQGAIPPPPSLRSRAEAGVNLQLAPRAPEAKVPIAIEYSSENRTSATARLLIYNRVPKCGSTTMQAVLRTLSRMNNFTHRSSIVYGHRRLSPGEELQYAHSLLMELADLREPLSVDRHFYFLDFEQRGLPRPVYINMLREPVERFTSSFYYARSPQRWEKLLRNKARAFDEARRIPRAAKWKPAREGGSKSYYHNLLVASQRRELESSSWATKNFTSCVLHGDKECSFLPGATRETTVSFFCGSDEHCLVVNGTPALAQAKRNLEERYSVVGIVEELDLSMAVMEQYIPRFLHNMRRAFQKLKQEMRQRNKTPHPEPLPVVRAVLERNLTADIELYQFARQRLHLQAAALGVDAMTTTTTPRPSET